jgi:hypothetical protein
MNVKHISLETVKPWMDQNKPIKWICDQINISVDTFKKKFPGYKGKLIDPG